MIKIFQSLGEYLLLMRATVSRPEKARMYWIEAMRQCYSIGVGSLPIIAIISLFMGAVTAVQFSYQLRGIGLVPMWWMGSIVRKSMILELAPTLSALLLAGKVGSNIASELGTMRISEQIDAYEIMGVNTRSYLIGPKIIASLLMFPMLVVLSVFLGISGGWLAGILGNFYSTSEYVRGLQDAMKSYDIFIMFIKSVLFAFTISSISCFKGYTVEGGAIEIGMASTQAVVQSSVIVIIVNFLVAFLML
ncbi:MAG: ABC transporter permease [Chitinophagales bacterium]|nr:ABC transporter permease [Chitinophagales bacterium]OJV24206.1 MAG: ABC transporter permease [Bacteroidetes bacterium 37-13]